MPIVGYIAVAFNLFVHMLIWFKKQSGFIVLNL